MEDDLCDLKVLINGHHTFFLNQRKLSSFSARLKNMIEQAKKKKKKTKKSSSSSPSELKMMDFPGGPDGFELITRFCYNNGSIPISPSNICTLHCSALLLEMPGLLTQSQAFLDGLFYWTWDDILTSLRPCNNHLFPIADSSGLLLKLVAALVSKISENSDAPLSSATPFPPSPCSSSSSSSNRTPDSIKNGSSFSKAWWFDDLTVLPPAIIEKMLKTLGAFGDDNKNLTLTRFLLHYLTKAGPKYKLECNNLADTAVSGVVLMGRSAAFSCRGLFWVLRVVSSFGLSRECRQRLERVIGLAMDQATLDDLLVTGRDDGVYDVSLVLRLVRLFVSGVENRGVPSLQMLKKVGRLVDKYLGEIAPDQGLKVPRFLAVAECLPDSARDCFDGVYRALDIYLESHPALSSEERTRLCRCLNYEKLTLEACKDLAKNPRIPPGAAIQAMVSQQAKLCKPSTLSGTTSAVSSSAKTTSKHGAISPGDEAGSAAASPDVQAEKEELRVNLQKMQYRVMELEKVCVEMKSQMTKMVRGSQIIPRTAHQSSRGIAKFC